MVISNRLHLSDASFHPCSLYCGCRHTDTHALGDQAIFALFYRYRVKKAGNVLTDYSIKYKCWDSWDKPQPKFVMNKGKKHSEGSNDT